MLEHIDKRERKDSVDSLESVVTTLQSSVRLLIDNQMHVVSNWSKRPDLLALAEQQLETPRNRADLIDNPALEELKNYFREQVEMYGFRGFFLISPDYITIAAMGDLILGKTNLIAEQREAYLDRVLQGESLVIPPIYSKLPVVNNKGVKRHRAPTMFVATPVRNEKGQIIAILAGRFITSNQFEILSRGGHISATSESYLFDDSARLLSKSRFEEQLAKIGLIDPDDSSVLNIQLRDPGINLIEAGESRKAQDGMPLMLLAESAINGGGVTQRSEQEYNDYRGVPVLGAWRWDERLGIGMAAEIELADALGAARETRAMFIGIMLAATILSIGLVLVVIETRKRSELQMQQLASAVYNAAEAIVVTDPNGLVEYANPAYESVFGYSGKEISGQYPSILDLKKHPQFKKNLWASLKKGKVWAGQLSDEKQDGESILVDCTISPIFGWRHDLLGFVLLLRDISNQVKLEEMLRQSQKMQAMGTFAGGVAHDFNNILAGILGHTELALEVVNKEAPLREDLEEILEASLRGADLVRQILSFSRKDKATVERVNLENLLGASLKLLKHTIPAYINLKRVIEVNGSLVLTDQTRLQQVVLNLCSNAAAAIGDKPGTIEVSLRDFSVDDDFADKRGLQKTGDYLKLTVADSGSGIAPENLNRIFEPFFTTKEPGRGTGLGLSQVHSIIEDYGGTIEVESELGKGSSFIIYLPKAENQSIVRKEDVQRKRSQGSERILLVDDEVVVTNVSSRILKNEGYEVVAMNNPLAALEAYKSDPYSFSLVITDLNMPGMKGDDLALAIHRINNSQAIILCSGFIDMLSEKGLHESGIQQCLMKPVSTSTLTDAVRSVLDDHTDRKLA